MTGGESPFEPDLPDEIHVYTCPCGEEIEGYEKYLWHLIIQHEFELIAVETDFLSKLLSDVEIYRDNYKVLHENM